MLDQIKKLSIEEKRGILEELRLAQQPTEEELQAQREAQAQAKAEREAQLEQEREAKIQELQNAGFKMDGSLEDHIKLCGCPKKAEERRNNLDEVARVNDIVVNALASDKKTDT